MSQADDLAGRAAPANDTDAPENLPIGGTYETPLWRVHRYADSAAFTHLVNAGKRGKKCMEIQILTSYGRDRELLDLMVGFLLQYVALEVEPDALAWLAKDSNLLSPAFETVVSELRGIDVETRVLRIETDLVRAEFSKKEFRITVTQIMGNQHGGFRQDSHLYNADKRSVPKAYQWARENAARIGSMTWHQLYSELRDAGVKVGSHG